MTDPLRVQPDGVRSYAQIHDQVVAALGQVMGTAAPEALGVETTHGPIASAVSTALGQVLGSRQGTLQATSTSGQTISELLQKAAQMYEQGDQKGAETLKAAAEAMEGASSANAPADRVRRGANQPLAPLQQALQPQAAPALRCWARCSASWDKSVSKSGRWPRRRALHCRRLLSRCSSCPSR